MATVVLDPYTNESSWVLKSAVRLLEELRGCHARVSLLVTANETDTRHFLGPITDDFLTFTDPDRSVVKASASQRFRPSHSFVSTARSTPSLKAGTPPSGARSPKQLPQNGVACQQSRCRATYLHSLVPHLSANHLVNLHINTRSLFLTFPFRASSTIFEKPSPRHGAA